MHRLLIALVALLLSTQVAAAPMPDLARWEGHYPSGSPVGQGPQLRDIFTAPGLEAALRRTLPRALANAVLREWVVEGPIEREGQILNFHRCKPHDCGNNNAEIFIDMETGTIQACVTTYNAPRPPAMAVDTWYDATGRIYPVRGISCFDASSTDGSFGPWRRYGIKPAG